MNDEEWTLAEKAAETERLRHQVLRLCNAIPQGRVSSYGAIGAQCDPPISGYICGRVMGQIMDGVPWWRIVGKDGRLPISKRGPSHSNEQRERLENEGVKFDDEGRIERRFFIDEPQPEVEEQGSLF
ncbi:DNA base-flipping protein [Abditibacteriota bacterium]|nr:DNA base-flipping protein [Abditibacteriota bacterium]